jgi:hypothetical protein
MCEEVTIVLALSYDKTKDFPEPVFANFLRSLEIDSQPGGIDSSESIPGLLKRFQTRARSSKLFGCTVYMAHA